MITNKAKFTNIIKEHCFEIHEFSKNRNERTISKLIEELYDLWGSINPDWNEDYKLNVEVKTPFGDKIKLIIDDKSGISHMLISKIKVQFGIDANLKHFV